MINLISFKEIIATILTILFFLLLNFSSASKEDVSFIGDIPEYIPVIPQARTDESQHARISPAMLEAINGRPLFVESRRLAQQEQISNASTMLIDGNYIMVELIGTIESTDNQIAAFALGGESTVWLQRNHYLGDWQIEEIAQHRVRLVNEERVRLLLLRKAATTENQEAAS
jgi:hypothetical protein